MTWYDKSHNKRLEIEARHGRTKRVKKHAEPRPVRRFFWLASCSCQLNPTDINVIQFCPRQTWTCDGAKKIKHNSWRFMICVLWIDALINLDMFFWLRCVLKLQDTLRFSAFSFSSASVASVASSHWDWSCWILLSLFEQVRSVDSSEGGRANAVSMRWCKPCKCSAVDAVVGIQKWWFHWRNKVGTNKSFHLWFSRMADSCWFLGFLVCRSRGVIICDNMIFSHQISEMTHEQNSGCDNQTTGTWRNRLAVVKLFRSDSEDISMSFLVRF